MNNKLLLITTTAIMLSGCAGFPSNEKTTNAISIEQTERGVEIRAQSAVFFDSGKSDIKPTANELLDNISNILKNDTKNKSVVEGHADTVGNENTNKNLSDVRAMKVMKALLDRGVN